MKVLTKINLNKIAGMEVVVMLEQHLLLQPQIN